MRLIALAVLFLVPVAGQTLERTFQLVSSQGTALQEILTTLRTAIDLRQVSADIATQTITVTGTPDQIAVCEWLIPKLDVLPGGGPMPQKYLYAGNNNDIVEIFELKNAPTLPDLQEVLTSLRTVADIQKIYQLSAPRMLIMRADAVHIALAESLIPQMDQPAATRTSPTVHTAPTQLPRFDTSMVYGLAHTTNPAELQQILTALRTVLDIQKIYQRTSPKLLISTAESAQIQMAQWLVASMDLATAPATGAEMRMPNGADDVVHVFYPAPGTDLKKLTTNILQMGLKKTYPCSKLPSLVVRGTADQIAMAAKTISQ